MFKKLFFGAIIILFFAILFPQDTLAGTATLNWNANTEPDLAGYKIYYGTTQRTSSCPPGGYSNNINVGNVTSYIFNNLTDGQTYYFSITAYDTSNNESCFSGEVSKLIPSAKNYTILKTGTAPVIDGNVSEFSSANAITITNTSGATGTYRFMYDSTALYISASVSDTQLNASIITRDGNLYNEDSIELFFDTLHDEGISLNANDYKFYLNLLNTQTDAKYDAQGTAWNATWNSAVNFTGTNNNNADSDTRYTMEIRILWTSLGISAPSAGAIWGLDISLNDKRSTGTTQTAWANTNGGGFNDPVGWGNMTFSSQTINVPTGVTNVNFTPSLEGTTNISSRNFTITILQGATQKAQFTSQTNVSGQISLPSSITDLQPGTYDILAGTQNYLKVKKIGANIASNSTIALATLKAGDINNDGIINSLDWSPMNTSWFTNDPSSDLNKDGLVNALDFSWINKNWLLGDAS